jgi:hypothetical protein
LKEEMFEDADSEDTGDVLPEPVSNDTNEEDLFYFARLSNHYICLVKASTPVAKPSRHIMQYPIIADSGANFHMFKDREFFETLHPATGHVILGDGKTSLSIKGVGTVKCKIGSNILRIENVRYIPDLAESIYSLFLHIKCPHHGLHSSFDTGLFIVFSEFRTKAIVGNDDFYLDAVPVLNNDHPDPCSESSHHCNDNTTNTDSFCHNMKIFQEDIFQECHKLDNLLSSLRRYYKEVKTKRQLNLDVPAGFRKSSQLQQQFRSITPPRKSSLLSSYEHLNLINEASSQIPIPENCSPNQTVDQTVESTDYIANNSSMAVVPIL